MPAFPPIEELIPHRGSMLLLHEVLATDEESITVQAIVAHDAWYADEHGAMPAWIGIELMAQAAAAFAGMEARARNLAPKRGMLIGCRAYRAASPSFSGALTVRAARTASDQSGFSLFECSVAGLVTGTIQVLIQ